MLDRPVRASFRRAAVLTMLAAAGCASSMPLGGSQLAGAPAFRAGAKASPKPVPCSQFTTLRELHREMSYVKNPRTGDTLEYVVLGDGAKSNDVLVYFPGTGQIIPGWPTELIANSKYSPNIVNAPDYRKSQDGNVSLCHDYRLVFFDYPGVGHSPAATYTRDDVANDVDAMLQDIAARYGISTSTVDPVGWSLGTTFAMKYAFLSPVSRPTRRINDVILYSAHGGGAQQTGGGSGSASCVQTLFKESLYYSGSVETQIKLDLSELIFPFKGQQPTQNGTNSGCKATVTNSGVTLTVTPVCNLSNGCSQYIDGYLAAAQTPPWKATGGIDSGVYLQERQQSGDWNVAYCAKAMRAFTSGSCTLSGSGSIQQSITNGGVCETNTSNSNEPVSVACDRLAIAGKVTALDAHEDLLVQWTYDQALVDGLNAAKPGTATFKMDPLPAGHGLLIQDAKWVQAQTYAALQ